MRFAPVVILALACNLIGCTQPRQQANPVFVPVRNGGAIEAQLETYVYLPNGGGRGPVVILSHGSAAGSPKATEKWSSQAAYLTSKGYVVVAPMRRGRGRSSGVSLEGEEKNCDLSSWDPGLRAAMRDLDAVIEYTRSLPDADSGRLSLFGVSRGGFLSVAYAAEGKYKASVGAVINFVGGWVAQAEDQCPMDFNALRFARYGAEVSVPTLWLYGANDLLYGDAAVTSYAEAFRQAGGSLQFHLLQGIPENGHFLLAHQNLWQPYVDAFLSGL